MRLIDEHRKRVTRQESGRDYEFVFSTRKIIDSASIGAVCRRTDTNALLDIGWNGNNIDIDAITAFANGDNLVRYDKLIDQTGRLGYINHEQNPNQAPMATNASYQGLLWANINGPAIGLYKDESNLDVNFNQDWIVHYCFTNEQQNNNDRTNILIRTNKVGSEGNFVMGMRGVGGNYIVHCIYTYRDGTNRTSDIGYTLPKGDNITTFMLYTFSYIGGAFKFYRNGVERSSNGTTENIGGAFSNGIYLGLGYSSIGISSGKVNLNKGVLMKSGDLSSLNVADHITEIMTKFGVI